MAEEVIHPDATDEICFAGYQKLNNLVLTVPELEALARLFDFLRVYPDDFHLEVVLIPESNTYAWEASIADEWTGEGKTPLDAIMDLLAQMHVSWLGSAE